MNTCVECASVVEWREVNPAQTDPETGEVVSSASYTWVHTDSGSVFCNTEVEDSTVAVPKEDPEA